MYEQEYMCIMLERDGNAGFLKYGRRDSHCIWLISATDFNSFELLELYLTPEIQNFGGITQLSERPHLEMILSTKCEETVSFVQASPEIPLETHESQAQLLYCFNVMTEEKSLSLKFKVTQSQSGITTAFFVVEIGLKESFPWCKIFSNTNNNSSPINYARMLPDSFQVDAVTEIHDRRGTRYERVVSDRAIGQLPHGTVVYAAAKGSRDPLPLSGSPRQSKPACYTLYITLLTGNWGHKSKAHQSNLPGRVP
jgi:hypothetical protein